MAKIEQTTTQAYTGINSLIATCYPQTLMRLGLGAFLSDITATGQNCIAMFTLTKNI